MSPDAPRPAYRAWYRCPDCAAEWQAVWDCACDEECPSCDARDIEARRADRLESGKVAETLVL